MQHKLKIAEISNAAANEAQLTATLNGIIHDWSEQQFPVLAHKDQKV